ncbi:Transposase, TnpA family (plasmid) [Nostoc flagelliforme CCNUN1]|uniref:Transposase, TnpA family n=1 Tax=Nostoc flagelliforme CCNUN1 TaxID=2038116 RepID=A0A2K8T5R2_9NOSO|nr:Tn3 family transposase [Nostoc flagelliforme]AUB35300.1 Transposase, TnpA family [Nostoc flagelliforme CCNUN1]AUB35308.1 Transposase, TnpA family [Nostoc flagelliforme CCNUN1]AUB37510.1 Transposase, TnpA family [Nostoc flagelliforme CCNUN1]AUB41767.1 Transposase, TnpA family [Nostoc flagelliforme CCNUN1]AUB42046.1 Transposase, TnpA family [Nostoc flagelliforme CCNUN1]
MTSIERTAYPRLKRYFTAKELTEIYTPTKSEIAFAYSTAKGQSNIFNLIVLLKAFQRLGYFPKLSEIPNSIINHIRGCLKMPSEIVLGYENNKTMYRHRVAIREYLKVNDFDKNARHLAALAVHESAKVMDNPADLINVAIGELIKQRYELPGFYTLDRLVRRIRHLVNQKIFNFVINRLEQEYIEYINSLLDSYPTERLTPFNNLKQLPKRPTRNHLNDLLIHFTWLETLGDVKPFLDQITATKIQHFAAEARVLTASEMKAITLPKRITILLCLIYSAQVQTRDNLIEMFLKRMRSIHHKAKEELDKLREKQQSAIERLLGVFTNVLEIFVDEPVNTEILGQVNQVLAPGGGAQQLLNECEAVNAYKGNNYLPLIWRFYKSHRRVFFRLLSALKFSSTSSEKSVVDALKFLVENSHRRGEFIKESINLDFASPQWQKLVLTQNGEHSQIIRRHLEVCVFSYLAAELRSGDICVHGSEDYADHREQLLPWSECLPLIDQYCQNLGLASTADSFVQQLKSMLADTALQVDEAYPDNRQVVINDQGEPVLKKPPRHELSLQAKALIEAVEERFPERNLIDILKNVDYWTNFTRHFGPMSGSDPKLEHAIERYLLTTFAYGCNLGPTQAARHMRGVVTARELSFVNRRHVNADKLNAALTDIINRYNVLNLPKLWGDGSTAAADGTKYELYEDNLLSEYHIRYGGYGGIAYHHVADSYVALFSHFISCGTWEAVYIIEGLLKNNSDIQPDTIHADTQGQSTPVFALAYLLGIKLMPRIRNWKDLNFFRPDKETIYKHIDLLFKDPINWGLIKTHWQDLLQVVLSIQAGKVSSPVLLRKLGNYSHKNRLYQAFQELGRVVRTVFLLEYISDIKLRQQITAATNKVEAYHGFSKWFFFGGFGIIGYNSPEEQEKIIKYNDLIANAVIFHNVVDLTNILRDLKREGYLIMREDVTALSPYMNSHIKRFGDYSIDLDTLPQTLDEVAAFVFV